MVTSAEGSGRCCLATAAAVCLVRLVLVAELAHAFPCSQPVSSGPEPTASDCLFLLRAAVGTTTCPSPCSCDVDGDEKILARDALLCLLRVVGRPVDLACPRCTYTAAPAFARVAVDLAVPWTHGPCVDCPERLLVHVFLDADGTGSIAFGRPDLIVAPIATQASVAWSLASDTITVGPGRVPIVPDGLMWWDAWELVLDDEDGDGVLEHGRGTVRGEFEQQLSGDLYDSASFDGGFATVTDETPPTLALYRPGTPLSRTAIPSEVPLLRASEPLFVQDVLDKVRLLVDGFPVGVRVEPVDAAGAVMTQARLRPAEFLPFDATITLDPGDITDAWGNPGEWSDDPLVTPADPGSATTNPGFEGTGGWLGLHVCSRVEVVAPSEGFRQACLLDYGELDGYVDLDATATELVLSVSTLTASWGEPYPSGVVLRIIHPTGTITAYDASAQVDDLVPYDCGESGRSCAMLPPRDVAVDVADLAGERVFIHAEVTSAPPFAYYALLLDDLRIR